MLVLLVILAYYPLQGNLCHHSHSNYSSSSIPSPSGVCNVLVFTCYDVVGNTYFSFQGSLGRDPYSRTLSRYLRSTVSCPSILDPIKTMKPYHHALDEMDKDSEKTCRAWSVTRGKEQVGVKRMDHNLAGCSVMFLSTTCLYTCLTVI